MMCIRHASWRNFGLNSKIAILLCFLIIFMSFLFNFHLNFTLNYSITENSTIIDRFIKMQTIGIWTYVSEIVKKFRILFEIVFSFRLI
jgi:hypothetical protein